MRLTLPRKEKLIITNVPIHPTIVRGTEFDFPEEEELDEPT